MNTKPTQTIESVRASGWFATYLREKCVDRSGSIRLAKAIGMERKQIYKYANGECSPKLDTVAKILAYYGDFEKLARAVSILGLAKEEEYGS